MQILWNLEMESQIVGFVFTGDVRGVFELLRDATAGSVGEGLPNKEDVGKTTLAELADDLEAVVVDPNISASVNGVV